MADSIRTGHSIKVSSDKTRGTAQRLAENQILLSFSASRPSEGPFKHIICINYIINSFKVP